MKKVVAVLAALAMLVVVAGTSLLSATSASAATPGTSPQNPIVVGSVSEVPANAVEDATSTYNTAAECDTTRSWVNVKPAVNEVSHQEWTAETRTRTEIPQSHQEWGTEKRTRTKTVEYRFPKETRSWVPAVVGVKEYTYKKPKTKQVAEYKYKKSVKTYETQYEWDKKKQKQKARWNGNTYIGPISYGYGSSYGWRDAGFAPVWSVTQPTAPGPVRGEFIHNSGGSWYYTTFYEYQKTGATRQVETSSTWEYYNNGDWTRDVLGSPWVKYDERSVTVPDGYEYKDWTTEVLDSPWIQTGERWKVEPRDGYWTTWTFAGYTNWSTSSTAPVNTDTVRYGARESRNVYGNWSDWTVRTSGERSEPNLPANTDTTEYRVTGPVTVTDPSTYTEWSDWIAYGNNPYLSDPQLPEDTSTQEYRKFGPITVVDSAAQPEVRTYYAWSDGKVCTTTTPTPTPEPPVVTPPTPEPPKVKKKKPAAKIRAACTGQVVYLLNNSKSNVAVPFKYARNGIVKTVKVKAGKTKVIVKQARAYSVAWVKAPKMKTIKARVPGACTVPHAGV